MDVVQATSSSNKTQCVSMILHKVTAAIGAIAPRFRDPDRKIGAWVSTALVVGAWGALLLMGVTDPRGGIQTLYPLFGIANQLIAAIALTVCAVVVANKGYFKHLWIPLIPLAFDVAVTFTASYQKIFSQDPAIGYFKQWSNARASLDGLTDPALILAIKHGGTGKSHAKNATDATNSGLGDEDQRSHRDA